jgi:ethanolamine utilization protein EutM
MSDNAMGFIETIGYATAIVASDYALKAANVKLLRLETVIGVGKMLGVTAFFSGDVAAVQSAIEAGKRQAMIIGTVVSAHVIPNMDIHARLCMLGKDSNYSKI